MFYRTFIKQMLDTAMSHLGITSGHPHYIYDKTNGLWPQGSKRGMLASPTPEDAPSDIL